MRGYINRLIEKNIQKGLESNPAVAILGPRQSGKSTLAKNIKSKFHDSIYLDLENPADLRKLDDPITFFKANSGRLVCLDEIQRRPELFPVLRSIIDEQGTNGQLLILGSASRDLIHQSSETLAGRIAYFKLTPFMFYEAVHRSSDLFTYWFRGGFPRSYLAKDNETSIQWRNDFIRTFLERDIPQLGLNIKSGLLNRLWRMIAHVHGQVLNSSKLGDSLGITNHTVRNYIDILEQAFILRILPPYEKNIKKRLIKSPKVYIRDSGLTHALLEIDDFNALMGHPAYGPSWEGLVIENILSILPDWRGYFYRTSDGAEIDLVLEHGTKKIAIECKASSAPEVSRGFWISMKDLGITEAFVIAPVNDAYFIKERVKVLPLHKVKDIMLKL